MKKIASLLFFSFFLGIHVSMAQDYPAAGQQWHSQHNLMKTGRATGRSAKHEEARLRVGYKHVRKAEKRTRQQSWLASNGNGRKHKAETVGTRSTRKNTQAIKSGR